VDYRQLDSEREREGGGFKKVWVNVDSVQVLGLVEGQEIDQQSQR